MIVRIAENEGNMTIINHIKRELTDDEISLINSSSVKDRSHPAKAIITYFNSHASLFDNTNNAANAVLQHDRSWFCSNKDRLLDVDDYSSPSSFLAEVRTYGYLLLAGFDVNGITETSKPTPDFCIIFKDDSVRVEVNAKQYSKDESDALDEFNNGSDEPLQSGVNIREHVITPFGKPTPDENVTENAISRLAQIKQQEYQFSETEPSVLWIDFQDELWDIVLKPDSIHPLRSWQNGLYAGEIWFSLFGFNGAPIFAGETSKLRRRKEVVTMRHDGRFINRSTKIDAVF